MNIDDVLGAAERIESWVHKSPVLTSSFFDARHAAQIYFKCENFQKAGSFKSRGACNAVASLDEESAARGVAAASSGNHGQALARAAQMRGVPCWIVMPDDSSAVKRAAIEGYGGQVVGCEPGDESRQAILERVLAETGAVRVDSHDAPEIIAGQGTAILELLDEVGDLDVVVTPLGGGGLLSGTSLVVSARCPAARIIGAEPASAADGARGLASGEWQPSIDPRTVCDGLRTSLGRKHAWAILREHVDSVITPSEDEILDALELVLQRLKIVIEPSSAVAVAALDQLELEGCRVGVVLSGGNVQLPRMPTVSA